MQDPSGALAAVKKLPAEVFDSSNAGGNGNSRTASYYWIATRPLGSLTLTLTLTPN